MIQSYLRRLPWGWLLLTTLLLMSAAFYNGFPLVTSDSGAYIYSGMSLTVPADRPLTYGLFLRVFSLKHSLWGPVLVQSLLLAYVLWRSVQVFVPRLRSHAARFALLAAVVWASGIAWFSGQLMPDVFTPIGVLALALLVWGQPLALAERVVLGGLLLLASLMHSSNLLTYTLLLGVVAAGGWVVGAVRRWMPWRRLAAAAALVAAAWVALPGLHAAFGGGFTVSSGSHVFLMGKLVETGVLDRFLADNCADGQYRLCAFRDKLPNNAIDFIWSGNSPLAQTGGWDANRAEYRSIIGRVLLSPRYYPVLLEEAAQGTARQLTHVAHGDGLTPFLDNTNPFWKIQESFPFELKEYTNSQQNRGALQFEDLTSRSYLVLGLSALLLLGVLTTAYLRHALPAGLLGWALTLVAAVVLNAFTTANLANVLDRLQTRVAWVSVLAAAALLVEVWPRIRPRVPLPAVPAEAEAVS
ncbi:hypothetical protein LJ737_01700 [Hymenobacter sp. 15J16-1T3B]|uniref:hypothetical protein n=1 Tax=Hymenobacter sp. 15J16-1T3B TaxID=2886941 RepID=UPI001D1265FC|nr:hypothetical protein [Hymenobacter sp. 15J16-1T3B]MCC3155933.1 hypothetical protein [Hymenobacter sp. 15J16-1T3B]